LLRLHLSTWLAAALLAVIFVLIAVPAHPTGHGSLMLSPECWGVDFEYGWPWPFVRTNRVFSSTANTSNPWWADLSPPWLNWHSWRLEGDQQKFMPGNLAYDFAVLLAILLTAAATLEWRRRRLASPWQFTLRELFLATLLVACVLSWCMVRRGQRQQEPDPGLPEFSSITRQTGYTGPLWLRNLVGASPMGMFEGLKSVSWIQPFAGNYDDELADYVPKWKKCAHLESISTAGRVVGNRGLDLLAELPNLREADLSIGDFGAAHISRLVTIERLTLRGSGVDGAVIARLRALPNLKALSLPDAPVDDRDCVHLAALGPLEDLDLTKTWVVGDGLDDLAELKNLRTLVLSGTKLSDAGLAHIEKLSNVTALDLSHTAITDAGIAHIGKLTGLRILLLGGTDITNAGIAQLKPLENLRVLDVRATNIDNDCIPNLTCLLWLRILDVSQTKLTNNGLVRLRALKRLECLFVAKNSLTAREIKQLQDAMPDCAIKQ